MAITVRLASGKEIVIDNPKINSIIDFKPKMIADTNEDTATLTQD